MVMALMQLVITPIYWLFCLLFVFWPLVVLTYYIIDQRKKRCNPRIRHVLFGLCAQMTWIIFLVYAFLGTVVRRSVMWF